MAPVQNSLRMSPSYRGVVLDTRDAIALFQAALHGRIPMITRRPHDKERPNTIISGNTFVYNEQTSSIKRWTDGVTWSPSRISGNYLLYREMESSFPPGEKKRAIKRTRSDFSDGLYPAADSPPPAPPQTLAPGDPLPDRPEHYLDPYLKKCFVGSLIDSYHFKRGGLIKKTISIKVLEQTLHLVSYYTIEDIFLDRFARPTQEFAFTPMPEILAHTGWRVAIDANGEEDRSLPMPHSPSPPRCRPQKTREHANREHEGREHAGREHAEREYATHPHPHPHAPHDPDSYPDLYYPPPAYPPIEYAPYYPDPAAAAEPAYEPYHPAAPAYAHDVGFRFEFEAPRAPGYPGLLHPPVGNARPREPEQLNLFAGSDPAAYASGGEAAAGGRGGGGRAEEGAGKRGRWS